MTYRDLWLKLVPLYEVGEAQAIVRMLLETEFGFSQADLYTDKVNDLPKEALARLSGMMQRLSRAEPVQYVIGRAEFCGRWFRVGQGVLIPRRETEDLCGWIADDLGRPYCALRPPRPLKILDIGTGSGCIAVTLALKVKNSEVWACDISSDALLMARENAITLNAKVNFWLEDVMNPSGKQGELDVIVSNPPYITEREKQDIQPNVLNYEPSEALFVPDDDPLRFYNAIAVFAQSALKSGGAMYFETNPLYIQQVESMLAHRNFISIEMRNDRFGRQRFIKAVKS